MNHSMTHQGYAKKQVSEFIPYRLVQYYTERGVVTPETDVGEGRGKMRRYSKKNLVEFGIINELAGYGVSFSNVVKIFKLLRRFIPNHEGRFKSGKSKKRIIGKMVSGGSVLDRWEHPSSLGTYLILYRNPKNEFEEIREIHGIELHSALSDGRLERTSSALIINLGQIISRVKAF